LALTALIFALVIHSLYRIHAESGWFLGAPLLRGWPLIAVNVFIYGYICWLGFWFIRGTEGLERLIVVGWFAGALLWPLKMLHPQWAVTIRSISALGLAVALLAEVALLLVPPDVADRNGPN
jgi:hypothetical protein